MQKRRPNRDGAVLLAGERALPTKSRRRSPPPKTFERPTHLGEVRNYRGQRYVLIEVHEHTRRDGGLTAIAEWTTNCADCGAEFSAFVPMRTTKFFPNRRCSRHRAPGVRVKP